MRYQVRELPSSESLLIRQVSFQSGVPLVEREALHKLAKQAERHSSSYKAVYRMPWNDIRDVATNTRSMVIGPKK